MKIAIIGYSGAGKSTLAKALAKKYGCAVLHLDTVQFLPGWEERDRGEAREMVARFLDSHDAWVIDGNYSGFCHQQRMEQADRIVFLNLPRLVCLAGAFRRYRHFKGGVRDSMAPGCEEKFDVAFVKWILWEGRTSAYRRRYREICRLYADKIVICRSRRDVRRAALEI